MGLLSLKSEEWFRLSGHGFPSECADEPTTVLLSEQQIEERIAARLAARQARSFAEADRLRAELAAAGVMLEDQPGGRTIWRQLASRWDERLRSGPRCKHSHGHAARLAWDGATATSQWSNSKERSWQQQTSRSVVQVTAKCA
jgi:hypothetical protein